MLSDPASMLVFGGRVLLGGAFVFAGLRNVANTATLAQVMAARGVPFPRSLLYAGIVLQIVAGLLLFLGPWTALAAAALILFLVVATVMFHNFWDHQGLDRTSRINGVVANVALAGGFLVVLASAP